MSPTWFQDYTKSPTSHHAITIDGIKICYRRWTGSQNPQEKKQGLLFIHGYGAHSHWWDFIAPAFLEQYQVIAMDMSGAGDSDHREIYKATDFAREIKAVCTDARLQSPIVIGHSFGGAMTRVCGYLYGSELSGILLVDSAISRHKRPRLTINETPLKPPRTRYYKTLEVGARRFRLRPPQPCENKYIVDYIASHSLAETKEGFVFKLDQSLFARMQEDPEVALPTATTMISDCACPVGFIYGERSRFFTEDAVVTLREVIDPALLFKIPAAHHHVFLDQPLSFIRSLSDCLAAINRH